MARLNHCECRVVHFLRAWHLWAAATRDHVLAYLLLFGRLLCSTVLEGYKVIYIYNMAYGINV